MKQFNYSKKFRFMLKKVYIQFSKCNNLFIFKGTEYIIIQIFRVIIVICYMLVLKESVKNLQLQIDHKYKVKFIILQLVVQNNLILE